MSKFSNINNFLIGISLLLLSTNFICQSSSVVTIFNYSKQIPNPNIYLPISYIFSNLILISFTTIYKLSNTFIVNF